MLLSLTQVFSLLTRASARPPMRPASAMLLLAAAALLRLHTASAMCSFTQTCFPQTPDSSTCYPTPINVTEPTPVRCTARGYLLPLRI